MFVRRTATTAFRLIVMARCRQRRFQTCSATAGAAEARSTLVLKVDGIDIRIPDSIPYDTNRLYQFKDTNLERRVFTHSSAGIPKRSWDSLGEPVKREDNEHLEWVGDGILKGLTTGLIHSLYPEKTEGEMSLLQSALICTTFYAYLARKLGFKERIILGTASAPETLESDRVLAGQFEAFVGGMFDEMGITRYAELFEWFRTLMEPYARSFEQAISTSLRNSASTTPGSIPAIGPEGYYKWLQDFEVANGFPQLLCTFETTGPPHQQQWICTISLDHQKFHGSGDSKRAAREVACEKAYQYIRSKLG